MFCIVYFALFLGFREQEGAVEGGGCGKARCAAILHKIRIVDVKHIIKN